MTKEYTGPEFEIEFARRWLDYVVGGKVGADPRLNWQMEYQDEWMQSKHTDIPGFIGKTRYRWKPAPKRMVTIGYYKRNPDGLVSRWIERELVAPEVEAPSPERLYYVLAEGTSINRYSWKNSESEQRLLDAGCVFLKWDDAKAMAEWLAVCRKGGAA